MKILNGVYIFMVLIGYLVGIVSVKEVIDYFELGIFIEELL